jgi:hypothetical protein
MTDPFDEYGDLLRRTLHTEADGIMPAPDGLDRIRGKIAERQRRFGWNWFTASWVRPAVAAGMALGLTLLAVSAPPAIQQITSAGDQTTAPSHSTPPASQVPSSAGSQPAVPYPGAKSSSPRTSVSQVPPSVSGTSLCPTPTPGSATTDPGAASAAKKSATGSDGATHCPTPTPTQSTTTPPASPSPSPSASATASSSSANPAVQAQPSS